jgi:hypothetical protein
VLRVIRLLLITMVAIALLVAVLQGAAQAPIRSQQDDEMLNDTLKEAMRRQAKAANQQRQADLKRDADRLLQLATELKLDANKSDAKAPAPDTVRKLAAIEKLARSIKSKMKGDGVPSVADPSIRLR